MMTERTCHICGTVCTEWCPTCIAAFPTRRPAREMTVDERLAEWDLLGGVLEIPFTDVHRRIEELVGRPVWTHELTTDGFLILRQEIASGRRATFTDILDKIPAGVPVIPIILDRGP